MGKLIEPTGSHRNHGRGNGERMLDQLKVERRKLTAQLAKVDARISKIAPAKKSVRIPSVTDIEQWFDEMTDGLPNLPVLPADFSRADLYSDHD